MIAIRVLFLLCKKWCQGISVPTWKTKGTVLGIKHYGSENSELCIIFSNLFLVNVTNLYIQKEHFTLLDKDGKPSMFALVMIATLSTCAQLERDNISFRLTALA